MPNNKDTIMVRIIMNLAGIGYPVLRYAYISVLWGLVFLIAGTPLTYITYKVIEEISATYITALDMEGAVTLNRNILDELYHMNMPDSIDTINWGDYSFYTQSIKNSDNRVYIHFDKNQNPSSSRKMTGNAPLTYNEWAAASRILHSSRHFWYIGVNGTDCKYAIHEFTKPVWGRSEIAGFICISYNDNKLESASSLYIFNVMWWLWVRMPISKLFGNESDFLFHIDGPYHGYMYERIDTRHIDV